LLIGTKEREIIIFDFKLKSFTDVILNDEGIRYIEFSPDGSYVAVASLNGRIWLGKYPSMDPVRSWQAHKEGQTAISFHPSGRYLASGGKDKIIKIWTIPECTQVTEWEGHKYPVASVAFAPDGGRLATGSVNDVLLRGGDDTKVWSFEPPKQYISSGNENVQVSTAKDVIPVLSPDKPSLRKRLALVIGNGNYLSSSLANPENDARGIKTVLEQAGFEVIKYENLNQDQMKKAMDEFGEKLKNYDVGLFFYAGHGIQSKGYNYLIPVDASLRSEEQVEYDCVSADRVLALMEASGAKVNIIILDACRNNPFERSWTRAVSGKGLAFMNAPTGTVIAYATAPGNTASDGGGNNGLYTSAILETIKIPDITILQMFQKVRGIVSQKSNKQQIPWESTSLTGDFYFYQTPPGLK
jgi:WD40 repeat protein